LVSELPAHLSEQHATVSSCAMGSCTPKDGRLYSITQDAIILVSHHNLSDQAGQTVVAEMHLPECEPTQIRPMCESEVGRICRCPALQNHKNHLRMQFLHAVTAE
jgi:hypothetical protein